jgi:hypothetical protein
MKENSIIIVLVVAIVGMYVMAITIGTSWGVQF